MYSFANDSYRNGLIIDHIRFGHSDPTNSILDKKCIFGVPRQNSIFPFPTVTTTSPTTYPTTEFSKILKVLSSTNGLSGGFGTERSFASPHEKNKMEKVIIVAIKLWLSIRDLICFQLAEGFMFKNQ